MTCWGRHPRPRSRRFWRGSADRDGAERHHQRGGDADRPRRHLHAARPAADRAARGRACQVTHDTGEAIAAAAAVAMVVARGWPARISMRRCRWRWTRRGRATGWGPPWESGTWRGGSRGRSTSRRGRRGGAGARHRHLCRQPRLGRGGLRRRAAGGRGPLGGRADRGEHRGRHRHHRRDRHGHGRGLPGSEPSRGTGWNRS